MRRSFGTWLALVLVLLIVGVDASTVAASSPVATEASSDWPYDDVALDSANSTAALLAAPGGGQLLRADVSPGGGSHTYDYRHDFARPPPVEVSRGAHDGSQNLSGPAAGGGRVRCVSSGQALERVAPITPGGAGPVRVGQEGLDALGVTQNTTRIPRPSGTGYRVPDILDEAGGVIGEVRNVQSLSYTQQLRDYAWYAQQNGYQFDLYVRGSTSLSGPLQTAVDSGVINLHRALPG